MKNYILSLLIIGTIGLSSCKHWMDINHNPNSASASLVTMDLLLPACQHELSSDFPSKSNFNMLAEYITKSGEVSGTYTFLTGLIMPQNLDDWWQTFYETNANLKLIIEKAQDQKKFSYKGIALTLMVSNYQYLVDLFGNVPYSQACNPAEYSKPVYDKGEDIYNNILIQIDEAISALEEAINTNEDIGSLKTADIMCQGDLQKWKRYAYSIKLRILMRISYVQDVKAAVSAIADKCLFIHENVLANPGYYLETYKMNPFYSAYGYNKLGNELAAHKYYVPTSALVDMLRDNNDPRLRVFIEPRKLLGVSPDGKALYNKYNLENEPYIGVPFGQMDPTEGDYTSKIGLGILGGSSDKPTAAVASTRVMCGAEVGFFLAEAALRGLIPGGDAKAKEYYEEAVTSSMKFYEAAMQDEKYPYAHAAPAITTNAETAAQEYLTQSNDMVNWSQMSGNERKLEAICTQKWLSLAGYNPLEAWSEIRRNDLPKLSSSHSGQENKLICKVPYPQTERQLNEANVKAQGDVDVYNTLVFWDLKNDIVPRTEAYQ